MKITIHPAINGASVVVDHQEIEMSPTSVVYAFEDDGGNESLGGLERLLYDLAEHLGVIGNKHSKERIRISVVHGDNYECKDETCPICKETKDATQG